MKVQVNCTHISADSITILPKGVVYIDESAQPGLAERAKVLIEKYPKDIELYDGDLDGFDIKGSRAAAAKKDADFEAKKEAKAAETLANRKEAAEAKAPAKPEEKVEDTPEEEPEAEAEVEKPKRKSRSSK